ncbi:uncharacterized protein LOC116267745 [Nymphaea colorata]|nr:uncharacterized protein LOC116267745 [Nymphaea colorata]
MVMVYIAYGAIVGNIVLRLKDKQLAARLALKYLHRWELNAAMDVLTMCICHLPQGDPLRSEAILARQALQRYSHILCADDRYNSWQEVEADCKEDPEGLALRLAGKGAVSAALEVVESANLSIDLRRELRGRQLVELLTADPVSGGGPVEASRSFHHSMKLMMLCQLLWVPCNNFLTCGQSNFLYISMSLSIISSIDRCGS